MNIDLLLKSFIAFCIGVIVYKVISDRCSCNIVEGQTDLSSTISGAVKEAVAGARTLESGAAAAVKEAAKKVTGGGGASGNDELTENQKFIKDFETDIKKKIGSSDAIKIETDFQDLL